MQHDRPACRIIHFGTLSVFSPLATRTSTWEAQHCSKHILQHALGFNHIEKIWPYVHSFRFRHHVLIPRNIEAGYAVDNRTPPSLFHKREYHAFYSRGEKKLLFKNSDQRIKKRQIFFKWSAQRFARENGTSFLITRVPLPAALRLAVIALISFSLLGMPNT